MINLDRACQAHSPSRTRAVRQVPPPGLGRRNAGSTNGGGPKRRGAGVAAVAMALGSAEDNAPGRRRLAA